MTSDDKTYISDLLKSRFKKMEAEVKEIKKKAERHFDSYFNRKRSKK